MAEVIIVIHLLIVLALVALVLMQKSEGGGLGMGGGGGGFMTARGTANVLSRTTSILAIAFFVTSMTLSILATGNRQPRSILDGTSTNPTGQQQAPSGPVIPSTGQGVLDQLRQQQPQAPQAPAIPAPGPAPATPPAQ